MNSTSDKILKVDKSVWTLMLIACFCCFFLFLCNYYYKKKCSEYKIIVGGTKKNDFYQSNFTIIFKTSLLNDNDITWNFGDGTPEITIKAIDSITHAFTKEGIFTVFAKSEINCKDVNTIITVNNSINPLPKPDTLIIQPVIYGDIYAVVGEKKYYSSDIVNATSYEWRIKKNGQYSTISNHKMAEYTFSKPGDFRLQLIIDRDTLNGITFMDISVLPKIVNPPPDPVLPPPTSDPPPPIKIPEINGNISFNNDSGLFSFSLDPTINKALNYYFIQVQYSHDPSFNTIEKVFYPVVNGKMAIFGSSRIEIKELQTLMVKPNKQKWPSYLRFMVCLKDKKDNINLESCKYFPLKDNLRIICDSKRECHLFYDN